MVFSSPVFLFYFLPVVLLLAQLFRTRLTLQNTLLFVASLVFYFWGEKEYTVLVLFSVLLNFFIGHWLGRTTAERNRRIILGLGLVVNLSLLIYYKYYQFFATEFLAYFGWGDALPAAERIHLPLGISFFTFHGITYIVDLYRGEARKAGSFLDVSLYTLFYPQLIAGPIVRYAAISEQLNGRQQRAEQVNSGVRRFIIGLAKKIILANSLGRVADEVYALQVTDLSPSLIWFGISIFALQLYYDFSGYSDMAIGLARMVGFEFRENFRFPYAARSMSDLWKRWHISLTDFFRNYLYIPLGGSRGGLFRTCLNLLIVFTLTGLWHGPSWNCILWGLFTGLCIVAEKLWLGRWIDKLPYFFANLYALFLFITALMIFKIENGEYLREILAKAFFLDPGTTGIYAPSYFLTPDMYLIIPVSVLLAYPIHEWPWVSSLFARVGHGWLRECALAGLFLLTCSIMAASTYNPFIYFKF